MSTNITEKEFIKNVCDKCCTSPHGSKCTSFGKCTASVALKNFGIEVELPKEDFEIDFEKAIDIALPVTWHCLEETCTDFHKASNIISLLKSAYQKLLAKYNELKNNVK